MERKIVTLAEAKARLSELSKQAEVIITKRGKPVGRLAPPDRTRRPVNLTALRRLTDSMTREHEPAGEFMRRMRDGNRY